MKTLLIAVALILVAGNTFAGDSFSKKPFGKSFDLNLNGTTYTGQVVAENFKVESKNSKEIFVYESPMIEIVSEQNLYMPFFGVSDLKDKTDPANTQAVPSSSSLNEFCRLATDGRKPLGILGGNAQRISIQTLKLSSSSPSEKTKGSNAELLEAKSTPIKIKCTAA